MRIRKATEKDFKSLYKIGIETSEFRVSSSGEFMETDEFMFAIQNPRGTLLLAEVKEEIIGFIYADRHDPERPPKTKWVCLVYLVVKPEFRKKGIAQKLYDACVRNLKDNGATRIYGWANSEGDGSIIRFMEKNGFIGGHKYLWMDKEI